MDILAATGMFIMGSIATYVAMAHHFKNINIKAKALEIQNQLIKDEILTLADDIDQKARIQAINMIVKTQKYIFDELMTSIHDDNIMELNELLEKENENVDQ